MTFHRHILHKHSYNWTGAYADSSTTMYCCQLLVKKSQVRYASRRLPCACRPTELGSLRLSNPSPHRTIRKGRSQVQRLDPGTAISCPTAHGTYGQPGTNLHYLHTGVGIHLRAQRLQSCTARSRYPTGWYIEEFSRLCPQD